MATEGMRAPRRRPGVDELSDEGACRSCRVRLVPGVRQLIGYVGDSAADAAVRQRLYGVPLGPQHQCRTAI